MKTFLKTAQFGGEGSRPYKIKPPVYPVGGDHLLFLEQMEALGRVSATVLPLDVRSLTPTNTVAAQRT